MKIFSKQITNTVGKYRDGGFTFTEMLLSFSLFLILVSFFPLGVNILLGQSLLTKELQEMEWQVFVSQAKKEIRMCDELIITGDGLFMKMNGHLIEYKKWGEYLRRRVDGKGHELILQQVKSAAFETVLQGVRIYVSDIYGQSYSVLIRTPVKGNSDDT